MKKTIISYCRFLRTKMSYIPDVDNSEMWRENSSSTHAYWCMHTMQPAGPDDNPVAPESCLQGRKCFEHKDDVEE